MDTICEQGDDAPTKKVRHRKKQFLKTIQKQMEFYFSDANLSKNRYLGQLVSKDPQVDLTIFLSFNKIRDITTDVDDIKKALKKSEMLALTEDGNKVYRKTRVRQNENADESTIYVEQLPPDVDHEWLKSVFLPYGDVPYVSIPKYQHNGLNKGFAFVEFDSPESATKALEAFGAMGCRLTSEIPPEQICSIKQNITCHREEIPDVGDTNFKVPAEAGPIERKSDTKTKRSKPGNSEQDGPNDVEAETKSKPVKKRKISFDDDYGGPEEKSKHSEEGRLEKPKAKRETVRAEETDFESAEGEAELCSTGKIEVEDQHEGKLDKDSKEDDNVKSPESETRHSKKRKMKKVPEETGECVENDPEEGSTRVSKKRKKEIKEEPDEIGTEASDDRDSKDEETSARVSKNRKKEIKDEPDATEIGTEASDGRDSKDEEKENEGSDEVRKKKRSRNHKKKNKKEKTEPEPKMNLRVLSKSEWKRLRNKYLDLQKVKMSQVKQHLYRSRWAEDGRRGNDSAQDSRHGNESSQDSHHGNEASRDGRRGNDSSQDSRHGNESSQDSRHGNESSQEDAETTRAARTEKKFTFAPGVIIRLRFPEPPADVKKFKTDAKAHADVKYVDARDGWNEAYIRCATAEAANQMVAQQTWSQMDILTGVEEAAYWEKMHRDREVQCGRNDRVKVRGKAKLLAKVEKAVGKHIRFATEEERG